MEHIAARLAEVPGVVAVTLGGSRATGRQRPDSDWDFGLYYRDRIDADDVRALGWPGEVSEPGGWGPVVNGGAWLVVDGQRVDLCYRELDEVLTSVAEAEAGDFRIEALATFVAGIPTYVPAGELALCKVLSGALPRPSFPDALAASAPPRWRQIASMALRSAEAHATRHDATATAASLGQAVIAESQARQAERRQWELNEKGLVARAGLGATSDVLARVGSSHERLAAAVDAVAALLDLADAASTTPTARHEQRPIDEATVLTVLAALHRARVRVWVDGGWGVDALVGARSRDHRDLDLVVGTEDRRRAEEALSLLSFRHDLSARPGPPARVVLLDDASHRLDLHPVVFDGEGNGWQSLDDGAWGLYPAAGLAGRGSIGGQPVPCLTAELQLRHHLGYPPRATDRHDLRLLARHFAIRLPPGL